MCISLFFLPPLTKGELKGDLKIISFVIKSPPHPLFVKEGRKDCEWQETYLTVY